MIPLLLTDAAVASANNAAIPDQSAVSESDIDFGTIVDLITPDEDALVPEALPERELSENAKLADADVTEADDLIELVAAEGFTVARKGADQNTTGAVVPDATRRAVAAEPEAIPEPDTSVESRRPGEAAVVAGVGSEGRKSPTTQASTFLQTVVEGQMPPREGKTQTFNIAAGEVGDRRSNEMSLVRSTDETTPNTTATRMTETVKTPELVEAVARTKPLEEPKRSSRGDGASDDDPLTLPRSTTANTTVQVAAVTPKEQQSQAARLSIQAMAKDIAMSEADLPMDLTVADRGTSASVTTPTATSATAGLETARHVANQIAVAVGGQPGRPTEISLNPEELGRVRLTMTAVDATITLNVLAERPETTDLLRRHIDTLAQEFRDLGYEDISFSFAGDGNADAQESAEDSHQFDPLEPEGTTVDKPEQEITTSGLDLRL